MSSRQPDAIALSSALTVDRPLPRTQGHVPPVAPPRRHHEPRQLLDRGRDSVKANAHLSVIVPTRDTCDLTLKCLAAVSRAAANVRCEIVLVDDGGRDETSERVRSSFPDVRVLRHDVTLGFSRAANAGLHAASGSLLLLLNSDTEVQSDSLLALVDGFERDPTLGVAGAPRVEGTRDIGVQAGTAHRRSRQTRASRASDTASGRSQAADRAPAERRATRAPR